MTMAARPLVGPTNARRERVHVARLCTYTLCVAWRNLDATPRQVWVAMNHRAAMLEVRIQREPHTEHVLAGAFVRGIPFDDFCGEIRHAAEELARSIGVDLRNDLQYAQIVHSMLGGAA
jgi:hypothetical protein